MNTTPRLAFLTMLASFVLACSTHMVPLTYSSGASLVDHLGAKGSVRVGSVKDSRGTAPNWLGAIRGGYGNPLKKLYTQRPTSEVVGDAFGEALKSRGLLAEESSRYAINIDIRKLDCSYYVNREAHAHLNVELVSLEDSKTVYSRLYREDRTEGGVGAGIFGSVDHLRAFAETTLNAAVDQVLGDVEFRRALMAPTEATHGQVVAPTP